MWYEKATPTDPKVCNYFVDEWVKLGHEVVVVHYRTRFPNLYLSIGGMLPKLQKKLCGDNSTMCLDIAEVHYHSSHRVYVLSIPIMKYIPHGRFCKSVLEGHAHHLVKELNAIMFEPNVIIGHFCNPTIEIMECLKESFLYAKTAVVFHEGSKTVKRILGKDAEKRLNKIDVLGYRSMSIQRSIESTYKLKNKHFICYSGIPSSFIERETPIRKWRDGDIKSFLFVGRMVSYKYPKTIVEALCSVYPQKDFSMFYIGKEGSETKEILDFIHSRGLKDRVSVLGQIERENIVQYYEQSECFIMISDHETFGLVYLEAMSRGCITIAGSNGGMEGIIRHGENGFLCSPGDAKELASIIKKIDAMSKIDKERISINAMKTAREFSDSNVATYYLNNIL